MSKGLLYTAFACSQTLSIHVTGLRPSLRCEHAWGDQVAWRWSAMASVFFTRKAL